MSGNGAWSSNRELRTTGVQEVELRQEHDSREGGVRVKHDCMDAGGRATHGAVAEEARAESRVGNNGRDVQVSREGRMPVVTGGNTENARPTGDLQKIE